MSKKIQDLPTETIIQALRDSEMVRLIDRARYRRLLSESKEILKLYLAFKAENFETVTKTETGKTLDERLQVFIFALQEVEDAFRRPDIKEED